MTAGREDELARHELIGLRAVITRSSNPLHVGIKGVVVDETQNILVIASGSEKRRISKEDATYGFTLLNGAFVEVEGRRLLGRPADRVGKTSRRKIY